MAKCDVGKEQNGLIGFRDNRPGFSLGSVANEPGDDG